jgi:hypothetical protein
MFWRVFKDIAKYKTYSEFFFAPVGSEPKDDRYIQELFWGSTAFFCIVTALSHVLYSVFNNKVYLNKDFAERSRYRNYTIGFTHTIPISIASLLTMFY